MTARDVLARALFYEFTADPGDDNPPSWHVVAESTRDAWRRVADFVARTDGEKLEVSAPALYVNHPRTDVWPGDVVRDAERAGPTVWMADRNGGWWLASMGTVRLKERHDLPARLRLLVDGETGQAVR